MLGYTQFRLKIIHVDVYKRQVMGYLYLKDDFERVVSLTKLGVELLGIEI